MMIPGDKELLKNFLQENNIKYEEYVNFIDFNYKNWNIKISYDENKLTIKEK